MKRQIRQTAYIDLQPRSHVCRNSQEIGSHIPEPCQRGKDIRLCDLRMPLLYERLSYTVILDLVIGFNYIALKYFIQRRAMRDIGIFLRFPARVTCAYAGEEGGAPEEEEGLVGGK